MSTHLIRIENQDVGITATRYCAPAIEGPDRIRVELSVSEHGKFDWKEITLDRIQWNALKAVVDDGFAEFPA